MISQSSSYPSASSSVIVSKPGELEGLYGKMMGAGATSKNSKFLNPFVAIDNDKKHKQMNQSYLRLDFRMVDFFFFSLLFLCVEKEER